MVSTSKPTMKLALALLASASVGTMALAAMPAAAQSQAAFSAYDNSTFNYCDAKLIGAFFGETIYQAKASIGEFILNGQEDQIAGKLRYSRNDGNRCDWSDVPHGYNDAVKLGQVWGMSIDDAKSKAADYYTYGRSQIVLQSLYM